ncbi:hypothetical protein QBC35DRAFT_136706 [Podospora australis]|uniref:Uncharacterized protein n=1 Tax=Podospora australis TaxID=1536484 RepID=A0AAN6WZW6_9PEZI|nr:hypothetical protein QBC35DRAFT_136706 [Podospora australis]
MVGQQRVGWLEQISVLLYKVSELVFSYYCHSDSKEELYNVWRREKQEARQMSRWAHGGKGISVGRQNKREEKGAKLVGMAALMVIRYQSTMVHGLLSTTSPKVSTKSHLPSIFFFCLGGWAGCHLFAPLARALKG